MTLFHKDIGGLSAKWHKSDETRPRVGPAMTLVVVRKKILILRMQLITLCPNVAQMLPKCWLFQGFRFTLKAEDLTPKGLGS